MFDRQYLENKLAALQSDFNQMMLNLNAQKGAIQFTQHLLLEWDRIETEAKATAEQISEKAKEVLGELEK